MKKSGRSSNSRKVREYIYYICIKLEQEYKYGMYKLMVYIHLWSMYYILYSMCI